MQELYNFKQCTSSLSMPQFFSSEVRNTILSKNYSPGQMIADNTPIWWKNVMNNWCKGLRPKKGRGYALVIADDGQHQWVPGRHVKERKAEAIVPHPSSQRATGDGDNKTDDQQPL